MVYLIAFLVAGLIVLGSFGLASWLTHISMTKGHNKEHGWANYRKFKKEFVKYTYDTKRWKGSLFSYETDDSYGWLKNEKAYLHASIISFENKGMIMRTPLDYFLAWRLISRTSKRLGREKYSRVEW